MSITDELRTEARGYGDYLYKSEQVHSLLAIADRIDAEHERQLEVLYRDMSDAEYVKLPVDADGVPIHVGDWMTPNGMGMDFKVRQMHFNGKWSLDLEDFGISQTCPDMCHHAPTVEDVLREFVDQYAFYSAIEGDIHPDLNAQEEVLRQFAAKLKLAGDAE